MKRCPECSRDYSDATLSFCLNDGTELLYGLSPDEPATAILHSTADSGEGQTRAQVNTTNETGMLPSESMPRPASSAEYLVSQVKEHKKGVLLGLVSILVIAGAAFGVYKFAGGKQAGSTPSFESMKITKLTDTGRAGSAAISPDGKYVVHVKEDAGQQSLWVVHIATGSNVQVITPAEAIYGRMTFSPDGNYIYFRRRETGETNSALYLIPVLGGEPKKINPHVSSPVTFSPDGKRFAFVRKQSGDSIMLIANADGTGEHPVATAQSPESFEGSGPAWSPDGEGIATAMAVSNEAGGRHSKVVEVRVEDGSIKPIGSQKWSNVSRVAWLADGSGLIAACSEIGSNTSQVYQISYPSGEARKITNDLNNYHDISLTADSSSMVTVQVDPVLNIW
jgi:eukaryotic-like serine/threonine-protein kinase